MRKSLLPLFLLLLLSGCKKQKTCKEIFEESYEINVTSCMAPLIEAGVDSIDAQQVCACFLDNLYAMDSTYVKKGHEEVQQFVNDNWEKFIELCIESLKD